MSDILIDTDVILDQFLDRKPFVNEANALFSMCEEGETRGYITPVICSNLYYILRKVASHQKVISSLKDLLLLVEVLEIDQQVVFESLNSSFNDFEDALQNYTAEQSQIISAIITRNIKDYASSNLPIMTPKEFLESLT
jgi:predicted nucleic acid-binding protein